MDQKSWLWKKRSTEKILVADKATNSSSTNEEEVKEVEKLLTEKTDLERDLRISNEKLSFALSECNAKDNIAKKQVKIAEEAIAGWEKAETEAISLKQELDKVLRQKAASEERIGHLDAALKECMQQLRFVREEQEKRVHDAVTKTSEEFEKVRMALDDKLAEAGKRLAKLDDENTQLTKALSGKEKVIDDLGKYRTQVETELKALLSRVESTEKENASLKYEIRVLEKELDIRNEEREFNRRLADAAQKQQQESAKRIAELEMECQRLRLLVQKRLPGPATLAKMKSEVETLGKGQAEMRRRKSNPSLATSMEFCTEMAPVASAERINLLTEQLHTTVEENRALKDALKKKSSELQFSRNIYARTASKLSRGEGNVGKSLKGEAPAEYSVAASSDVGSDDKASCAESWASALILELEHFESEKQSRTPSHRNMGTLEMNLMDDFAEMEKLAVVSVDYLAAGSSQHSSEEGNAIFVSGPEIQPGCMVDASHDGNGHVVQTSLNESLNPYASDTRDGNNISNTEKSGEKFGLNVSMSIHKVLELLEGINIQSQENVVAEFSSGKDDKVLSYKYPENPMGYTVRVFQWKTAELSAVLQQFVGTCTELLNGTADLEQFVQQVAFDLEWVINHCFSIQDVSNMKDAIRNHLDWDESRSESEADSETADHPAECNKLDIRRDDMPYLSTVSSLNGHRNSSQTEALEPFRREGKIWNVEWEKKESSIVDLEVCLQSKIVKDECFMIKLQESKGRVKNLHSEMENTEQSKGVSANQIEKQKMTKEDLEAQLMETNHEWKKACERISCLENELENRSSSCKRLEETCRDLKIQLQSVTSKDVPDDRNHRDKQLQSDWEITAASEKLAECQETILNLGKQLKALASPSDAALFDKVISSTSDSVVTSLSTPMKNISRQSSLLNKMQAEDGDQNGDSHSAISTNAEMEQSGRSTNLDRVNREEKSKTSVASMDIVPCKKNRGRSFFKRLFWRQKKDNSDKIPISQAALVSMNVVSS